MKFGLKREDYPKDKAVEPENKPAPKIVTLNLPQENEDEHGPGVVNLKTGEPYDVYIGRPSKGQPMNFGNPFVIGRDGNREQVIAKFEEFLLNNPELMHRVKTELKGKVLGCFCAPLPCHGHILMKYANEPEPVIEQTKKLKP